MKMTLYKNNGLFFTYYGPYESESIPLINKMIEIGRNEFYDPLNVTMMSQFIISDSLCQATDDVDELSISIGDKNANHWKCLELC